MKNSLEIIMRVLIGIAWFGVLISIVLHWATTYEYIGINIGTCMFICYWLLCFAVWIRVYTFIMNESL